MSVMREEEASNHDLVASLAPIPTPTQYPALPPHTTTVPPMQPQVGSVNGSFQNLATKVCLQGILKTSPK